MKWRGIGSAEGKMMDHFVRIATQVYVYGFSLYEMLKLWTLLFSLFLLGGRCVGQTWQLVGGPQGRINAYDMIFTKSRRLITSTSNGIAFSDDYGIVWNRAMGFSSDSIHSFVQRANGDLLGATPRGLIRSIDNGETWMLLGTAGSNISESLIDSSLYYTDGKTVFKSSDGGLSWMSIWSADTIGGVAVNDSGWIYVGWRFGQLLRSKDGGRTFDNISVGFAGYGGGDISNIVTRNLFSDHHGSLYFKIGSLTFHYLPNETNQLYLVGWDSPLFWDFPVHTVTDNGSFIFESNYYIQEYVYASANTVNLFPLNNTQWQTAAKVIVQGDVWIISYGIYGTYRTNDGGRTWIELRQGFGKCSSLYVDGQGTMYTIGFASSMGGGFYKSTDKGETWNDLNPLNYEVYFVDVDRLKNTDLIAAGSYGILIYNNEGERWTHPSDWSVPSSQYVSKIGTVYVGYTYEGIYVSKDNGQTWVYSDSSLNGASIFCFGESRTGRIFAGASPSGIYYTDNDGMTWTSVGSVSIQNEQAFDFAYKSDTIFAATSEGIAYSIDNGVSWNQLHGLSGRVTKIVAAPNGDLLAAVANNGIYRSRDDGIDWQPYEYGLGNSNVHDLVFDATYQLFAVTDSGIFCTKEYSVGSTSGVQSFSLQQNFPNPFNTSTDILFTIPASSKVSLKVYNILGQEVETLLDQEFIQGNYRYRWDASNFSSGVYLLRLSANGSSKTIKTLLLK